MKEDIVLIDLFSGIGGFANGLDHAGFNITHHYFSEIDKKATSVYKYHFKKSEYVGSVIDVSGSEIRRKHPRSRIIICFGWPCQDNSIAGKRKGHESGTRSSLLLEAVRIIQEVQPDYFIAENVKGLYSVNEGVDFIEAIRLLSYLNNDSPQYVVEQQLLNTKWIIPQNRERTYFVGYPRDRGCRQILPIRETDLSDLQEEARINIRERIQARENAISRRSGEASEDIAVNVRESEHALHFTNPKGQKVNQEADGTLTGGGHSGGNHSDMTKVISGVVHNKGDIKESEVSTSIDASYHKGMDNHGQRTMVAIEFNRKEGKERNLDNARCLNSSDWRGLNRNQSSNAVEYKRAPLKFLDRNGKETDGKYAFTIDSMNTGGVEEFIRNEMPCANSVTPDAYLTTGKRKRDENGKSVLTSMHERRIRRLTETECEILQGFPPGWTEFGTDENGDTIKISSTQRYKQCGNAVSVPVVAAVAQKILKDVEWLNLKK